MVFVEWLTSLCLVVLIWKHVSISVFSYNRGILSKDLWTNWKRLVQTVGDSLKILFPSAPTAKIYNQYTLHWLRRDLPGRNKQSSANTNILARKKKQQTITWSILWLLHALRHSISCPNCPRRFAAVCPHLIRPSCWLHLGSPPPCSLKDQRKLIPPQNTSTACYLGTTKWKTGGEPTPRGMSESKPWKGAN